MQLRLHKSTMFRCINKGVIINLRQIASIKLVGNKLIFTQAMRGWIMIAGFGGSDAIKHVEEYPTEFEAHAAFELLAKSLPPKDELK